MVLHIIAHTQTRLTDLFPGLPRWAGTRKVKPTWILLKQETVSGSGISWATYKSAPRSRQITTPAPHHSFYRPDALPAAQPIASKHWRHIIIANVYDILIINTATTDCQLAFNVWWFFTYKWSEKNFKHPRIKKKHKNHVLEKKLKIITMKLLRCVSPSAFLWLLLCFIVLFYLFCLYVCLCVFVYGPCCLIQIKWWWRW